jgi:D-erythronate 2-dehydrogenase
LRIVVTGANGFIGHKLAEKLCEWGGLGEKHPSMTQLTLVSRKFQNPVSDPRVRLVKADITAAGVLESLVEGGIDCLFHIAAIPTGDAERSFDAGRTINLEASYRLFELLRAKAALPIVVFSSTIAVYGDALRSPVNDETLPLPNLSYGAQKWIGEILVTEYSRRGFIDGRAVRLPGVVARPKGDGGAYSLFLSEIFHAFAEQQPEFTCPVSPDSTPWMMSVERCIGNLIHAASIPREKLPARRSWMIPTLRVRMGDLTRELAEATGSKTRVVYKSAEPYESIVGKLPPLSTRLAEQLGFQHDGTVRALVDRVLKMIRTPAAPVRS